MRFRRLLVLTVLALLALPCASAGAQERIVGGNDASINSWPYLAAIRIGGDFACGGTLVAPDVILTAAHCTQEPFSGFQLPAATFEVVLGRTDINDPSTGEEIGVSRYIVHPQNDPFDLSFDVALLELSRATSRPRVRIIGANEGSLWNPGDPGFVAGWGDVQEGGPGSPGQLQQAPIPIAADSECDAEYSNYQPASMLCAGAGTPDTCQGDSGGPLVVPSVSAPRQVGITSFGNGCGQVPAVYAHLGRPAVRNWVSSGIALLSPSPGTASSSAGAPGNPPETESLRERILGALRADLRSSIRRLRRVGMRRLLRRRRVSLRGIDAVTAGRETAVLSRRGRVLARGRRSFAGPGRKRVVLRLTRRGRRLFRRQLDRRRRSLALKLTLRFAPEDGASVRRSRRFRLGR